MIERADRDHVTMAWKIERRTGKVFIAHNMNRSGANIAAAYSMRPEPGATLSTPLTWDEVEAGVTPRDFRIDNVWERFARVGDLFEPVRTSPQDLSAALEAVGMPAAKQAPTRRTSADVIAASRDPDLAEYLRKRDFGPRGTTEPPPGGATEGEGNSFVIHKHRATRLHYDVRLEREGALPSWAVPRGLPVAKGDKRLAVRTEDHPLEYGAFEGTIPEGHYGAGEVRNRARSGGLRSSELSDPTITVTNLGERGVETVFGVIYPPQVALVGFGKIVEQPWASGGLIGARPVVHVTLSADHRASDGHRGALLLAEIREALQAPETLDVPR